MTHHIFTGSTSQEVHVLSWFATMQFHQYISGLANQYKDCFISTPGKIVLYWTALFFISKGCTPRASNWGWKSILETTVTGMELARCYSEGSQIKKARESISIRTMIHHDNVRSMPNRCHIRFFAICVLYLSYIQLDGAGNYFKILEKC